MENATRLVPFVNEVEAFNLKFGKIVNYTPTLPTDKDVDFVCDFIIEETEELRSAAKRGDILKVLDSILDITFVCLGNATLTFGLKEKIKKGYAIISAANMNKACLTVEEAEASVVARSAEFNEPCHYSKVGDVYIIYRTRDGKALKSINWVDPEETLKTLFTEEELNSIKAQYDTRLA